MLFHSLPFVPITITDRHMQNQPFFSPSIAIASPTEPNTPSSLASDENAQPEVPTSSTDQQPQNSFSSLINYDPSSQNQPQSQNVLELVSHAEMLKLRLRVAMFKVRTGQIEVPFAELKVNDNSPANPRDQDAISRAVEQRRQEARTGQVIKQNQQRNQSSATLGSDLRPRRRGVKSFTPCAALTVVLAIVLLIFGLFAFRPE